MVARSFGGRFVLNPEPSNRYIRSGFEGVIGLTVVGEVAEVVRLSHQPFAMHHGK
jgi:hypothetical protein